MQMVAMALAGCSSIDVISILNKSKQRIDRFDVEVDAARAKDQVPAVFTDMHLHFNVEGEVEPEKVRRAIELSVEKYCSVSKMLEKTATITHSFSVNGERYEQS
jgi:putative redox protein